MRQGTGNLDGCPCTTLRRVAIEWETRPASQNRPPGAVGNHALPDSLARIQPWNRAARAKAPRRATTWLREALRTASGGHRAEEALFGLVAFCGMAAVAALFLESGRFVFHWQAFAQLVSWLVG